MLNILPFANSRAWGLGSSDLAPDVAGISHHHDHNREEVGGLEESGRTMHHGHDENGHQQHTNAPGEPIFWGLSEEEERSMSDRAVHLLRGLRDLRRIRADQH